LATLPVLLAKKLANRPQNRMVERFLIACEQSNKIGKISLKIARISPVKSQNDVQDRREYKMTRQAFIGNTK